MSLPSETEILICPPIKGSRGNGKTLKEREAGCSETHASVSPGPHLPLFRCSQLPAFWLLGRPWQCLCKSQVPRVASVSTAGSLLNPGKGEQRIRPTQHLGRMVVRLGHWRWTLPRRTSPCKTEGTRRVKSEGSSLFSLLLLLCLSIPSASIVFLSWSTLLRFTNSHLCDPLLYRST